MEGTTAVNDSTAGETELLLTNTPCASGRERAASRWVTVEPLVLLAASSYSLTAVLRIQYVLQRVEKSYNYNHTVNTDSPCLSPNRTDTDIEALIQADAARWMLLFSLAGAVPGFVCSILMGSLSDRFGRKAFLTLSAAGATCFAGVCTAVMAWDLPLAVFLAGDVAFGLTGGQMAVLTLCYSYVADVTTKARRTLRIIAIESVFIFTGLLQVGIEYSYQALGHAPSAGIATGLGALGVIYSVFPQALIETVETEGQQSVGHKLRQTAVGAVRLFHHRGGGVRTWCLVLIYVTMFTLTPFEAAVQIRILYAQAVPFCWTPLLIGYNVALFSVCVVVGNIVGFVLLSLCFSNHWIFQISVFSTVGAFVVFGLSRTSDLLFWSVLLTTFSGLCYPVLRGTLSKLVQADEQGVALAFLACVENLGLYVVPMAESALYIATVAACPPCVFFVVAAVGCISTVLFAVMHVVIRHSSDPNILTSTTPTD